MATKLQRAQSHVDALTNRATPQAQVVRLADAFAKLDNLDPTSMTLVQKAELILLKNRQYNLGVVKRAEGEPVAASAVAGNNAAIDTAFAEG